MPDFTTIDGNVYYNWYAATAGHGSRSMTSGGVNDSICPYGWDLPITNKFEQLINTSYSISNGTQNAKGSQLLRSLPFSNILAGQISTTGDLEYKGRGSFVFSSTAFAEVGIYSFKVLGSEVHARGGSYKLEKMSIRCFKTNS